jgi:seryl-tRNA synthetase
MVIFHCYVSSPEDIWGASFIPSFLPPSAQELPKRLVAFSHAFRTEAGSSGSENRGIYRLHQFSKALGVKD